MNKQRLIKSTSTKNIMVSIRINKEMKAFILKNNFSPGLIFREALKELGFKE